LGFQTVLKVYVRGLKKLEKAMGAQTQKQKKALNTAIKVEGYRQLRQLRDDIRAGKPGGRPYPHMLSEIARRTKTGRLKKNQVPLYRLARLLRYTADYSGGELEFEFGFVGTKYRALSTSWKTLVAKHEEGDTSVLRSGSRTQLGIEMARIGGRLKKRGDPDAKFFFLRKNAGRVGGAWTIRTPQRAMIDPHWRRHQNEARRNVENNFKRKMRGERI
jgi:hypothetical protein